MKNIQGFFLFLFLTFISFSAQAAVIDVTTIDDENNTDGDCSLREAVIAANNNKAVDGCTAGTRKKDEIIIPAGTYILSVPGTGENAAATGDLDFTEGVSITGAGSETTIIDANNIDRVMDVISANVQIKNIQITGGNSASSGGGISADSSTVTLIGTSISENTADDGGGIYINSSSLNITSSTVSGNTASSGNSADGGGIYVYYSSSLDLTNSTVSENTASSINTTKGGGIYVSSSSSLDLTNSTVSGNTASGGSGGNGGGIYTYDSSSLDLTNSTVSGNTASGGSSGNGGGIWNYDATVTLYNVTIANNTSDSGGGIYGWGNYHLYNSLIADNTGSRWGPDCYGTINSVSYSLIGDTTDCTISSGTPVAGLARLSALGNFGGNTQTHRLLKGSAAIDAGDPASCNDASGNPLTFDQRGPAYSRTADGDGDGTAVCDIGAFEKK